MNNLKWYHMAITNMPEKLCEYGIQYTKPSLAIKLGNSTASFSNVPRHDHRQK